MGHSTRGSILSACLWAVALLSIPSAAAPPLFESEKVQLTDGDLESFDPALRAPFAFGSSRRPLRHNSRCKVYPGDGDWPSEPVWGALKKLAGGAVVKPHPQATVCYDGPFYDGAKCAELTAGWLNSYNHLHDPIEMFSPVYQGLTCEPPDHYDSRSCTMGGYPWYVINATTTKHIQLGVNFARNTGVRLVVKNTGHDFSGKSGGAMSLSIWTHHFKDIEFIPKYEDDDLGYSGAAFKAGSGVQVYEIYQAAHEKGVVVVGGEGETVGIFGGYIQGGGHSPLSSMYGTGADQVLAFEVVLADGRFLTASPKSNPDLFWALQGGGGSTFGIVTSVTVKAHPDMPTTHSSNWSFWSVNSTVENFWAGFKAYVDCFVTNADSGTYSYFVIFPDKANKGHFQFKMTSFFAPNKTVDESKSLLSPFLTRVDELGFKVDPNITHFPHFYPAWRSAFPREVIKKNHVASASRLWPRRNFENDALRQQTFENLKQSSEKDYVLIGFNIKATAEKTGSPDNAVNPAWRENVLFAISSVNWAINATTAEIQAARRQFTHGDMQRWRDLSPGAGSYLAESDRTEPNFQQAFYGDKYDRLLRLKRKYDPTDVFYAATAVGSEFWRVETADGLPHENGRLCRAQ